MKLKLFLVGLVVAVAGHAAEPKLIEADICVYGGTSGGVAAAVQAARMGQTAVIAEPGRHLGGMTAGGLSAVDIGDPRSVGGIAREYFTRLVASYGKKLAWDQAFEAKGGGPATGGAYSIEPHVAERVFEEMAREANVAVHLGARLASVKKDGARIAEFTTDDGTVFRAKVFIDTTYEGDLMAAAGVGYTIQREGNAKYGEQYNGIYYDEKYRPRTNHQKPGPHGRVPGGQGVWDRDLPLDPYLIKGDPKSGLLPLIDAGDPGTPGDPAPGIQAYCFRLCLTTAPDRLPIAPPPNYDPKRYELVARFIEGCLAIGDEMDLRWFSKYDALPNDKWDFNTATFGGNLPGASWAWPEASYTQRDAIAREHENYHRGLLHFLATDPRVPAKVRAEMQRFGLPRDEFQDHGGWPHQIYVREGRRMISDLVLTEHHTFGREVAPHSIGLGSYGTDTHEIRRIVKDGVVIREGKTSGGRGGFGPYQIGYGAIVPKAAECENLLVPFALSASHTAFSSIRMEPVFMVTSQSAATAAVLAIEGRIPVQQVAYEKLKPRLVADGQVLDGGAQSTEKTAASNAARDSVPKPEQLDRQSYDLVVIGGTPGGIACAVRAAREGLSVLLVHHTQHLGGFMTSGAGGWEAPYDGLRSPLYAEMRTGAAEYYRKTYGDGSPQHRASLPKSASNGHLERPKIEPRVAEMLFDQMVAREKSLTLLKGYFVTSAEREGSLLKAVVLREMKGSRSLRVSGQTFADGMYEGDLAAAAKVPYRVGREARDEYHEPHAGVVFTRSLHLPPGQPGFPKDAAEGRLKIRYNPHSDEEVILPASTGAPDRAVMAYNYRLILTKDPENRVPIPAPVDAATAEFKGPLSRSIVTNLPNAKIAWNGGGRLIGPQNDYPEGDWETRERISRQYLEAALRQLWLVQNAPNVDEAEREFWKNYGLAKDEFPDNHNLPYEVYVREARRIVGRYVFIEQDGVPAPGLGRTPVHGDSIAVTDWPIDSVACLPGGVDGGNLNGILFLGETSRPAQVPYRSLLPMGLDNLLVPVALSASHIGFGCLRLEPVWMQTGEAAGYAAALAKKQQNTCAQLDPDLLVRTLVAHRTMITFLNDGDVTSNESWIAAAQYFGAKGFFHDYDARAAEPLKIATAKVWAHAFSRLKIADPMSTARAVAAAEAAGGESISAAEFAALLPGKTTAAAAPLTRGEALRIMYTLLP